MGMGSSKVWRASAVSTRAVAGSRRARTGRAGGTGHGSNEAGRDLGAWTTSYPGYMSCIAALKLFHVFGSSNISQTTEKVSQDNSLV